MELYPLKFKPVYKEKIWGGDRLATHFNRNLPDNNIGESWEVTAHSNGVSMISNGPLKGKLLTELIDKIPDKLMGKITLDKFERFPLLIKLLDANKKLSVQVHPNNNYARRVEGELGKTEMWYVIAADPGAKLVYGLKPARNRQIISQAIKSGQLEEHLNEVEVKAGDIFFMPSGTIHAIEEGILLAEIQQNSDTTYRVYDWNRPGKDGKPRELHIEKALDVINFNDKPIKAKSSPLTVQTDEYIQEFLVACPHFITEKIHFKESYRVKSADERMSIIMVMEGTGKIEYKKSEYGLKPGDTYLFPAILEDSTIKGNLTILKTYVPESKEKTINCLLNKGFSSDEISQLAGIKTWKNEDI